MARNYEKVYQFKITLKDIKPPIWRRIQVPETYTFWDLHVAIQDAMGWKDYHLHEFAILNPRTGIPEYIGIPDDEFEMDREVFPGWRKKIASYFSMDNRKAVYTYDFGDDWKHRLLLEKILPRNPSLRYPICVAGERACPPEDCGGVAGYEEFLEIIMDPHHAEYESTLEWGGREFEPERFDPRQVLFADPKKRWKRAFGKE